MPRRRSRRIRNGDLITVLIVLALGVLLVNFRAMSKQLRTGLGADKNDPSVRVGNTSSMNAFPTENPNHRSMKGLTVEQIQQWCPNATCGFNGRCDLCRRRFLIVLTSARSASTSLTWMLDMLPGVRMSGENNNLLQSLRVIEKQTFGLFSVFKSRAWARNPIPPSSFGCAVQEMIEVAAPPIYENRTSDETILDRDRNAIVGFKTIRFHTNQSSIEPDNDQELVDKVRFLREYFPCARFVVNIRSDVQAQYQSRSKTLGMAGAKDWKTLEELEQETDALRRMARLLGDQAILMDSSEWTHDGHKLNRLLEWLGFVEACHFSELLELNTKKSYKHTKVEVQLDPTCRHLLDIALQ